MKQFLFAGRVGALAACAGALGLGALGAGPAVAAEMPGAIDTTHCVEPALTQPFLAVGDSHGYALVPGQGFGGFVGAGWRLTGGAQVASSDLATGSGSVLDLPAGSEAVSPSMCVHRGFKAARAMVRTVAGKGTGVRVSVAYEGTKSAGNPKKTGRIHGDKTSWSVSRRFNVKPSNKPGWQLVRFHFAPRGTSSDVQIYDLYVDPRMKG